MKKILLGIIVISFAFISFNLAFSSSLEAKTFEEITYEQTLEIKKGKTKSYITSRGEKFSVGQTFKFGAPKRKDQRKYDYIWIKSFMGPNLGTIESTWNGWEATIKKIEWRKEGSQTFVMVHIKQGNWNLLVQDFEAAIESGEIVTSVLSKKTAIDKLKEAKELLDLEIITQDEYDEIKKSLTPFIMTD
tara:strand:- start:217 stop:783 length:567 start_codon:yes stop_codon:yes gene_type:complete